MTSSSRGQAAIEYILLLVVIVALVAGFMTYSRALQTFIGAYFEYFECLIVAGELPENDEGVCTYPDFNPGPWLTASNNNSNSSNNGGSSSGSNGGANSGTDSGNSGSSNSGSNSGDGSGSGSDGNGDGSDGENAANSSRNSRDRDRSPPPREGLSEPSSQSSVDESGRNSGGRTNSADTEPDSFGDGRSRTVPFNRSDRAGGRNKISSKDDVSSKAGTYDDFSSGRPRTVPVPVGFEHTLALARLRSDRVPATEAGLLAEQRRAAGIPITEREVAAAEDSDTTLSFGDWLRYLIIAAIVISIVVFFGLQIQQFRKSRTKG